MTISKISVLYLVLMVVGLSVTTSASDSETEYEAWLAAHQAKYTLAQQTTQSTDPSLAKTPTCIKTVGPKGSGAAYTSIKAALKSIPTKNTERCVIKLGAGTHYEKPTIATPYITLQGAGINSTFVEWGDTANSSGSTAKSSTVIVTGDFFIATDIAFSNTAPKPVGGAVGAQAVAFEISGDEAQFYRVAFYGAQDTLYDKKGRHYYEDCYIQGSIDFVFGDGQSYFQACHLNSIATPYEGSLTAQKRTKKSELTGFSFVNCTVTGEGPIYLGRAWGPYSRVVFALTDIAVPIIPQGWYNWGVAARDKTVYYGQYDCTGIGANTTGRVSWSRDLTAKEAAPFLTTSFVDGSSWIGKV